MPRSCFSKDRHDELCIGQTQVSLGERVVVLAGDRPGLNQAPASLFAASLARNSLDSLDSHIRVIGFLLTSMLLA